MLSRSLRPLVASHRSLVSPRSPLVALVRPSSSLPTGLSSHDGSKSDGRAPPANPDLDPTDLSSFSITGAQDQDQAAAGSSVTSVSAAGVEIGGVAQSVIIPGGGIIVAGKPLLWNVNLPEEGDELDWRNSGWSEDCLRVWEIIGPRPEMLLFGTGPTVLPVPTWIRARFSSLGIQTDVMSTASAAATYNVLAEEGRLVALAFLPSVKNVDIRTGKFADFSTGTMKAIEIGDAPPAKLRFV